MANMSAALGIRALADQIESGLANNLDPGLNPEALACVRKACEQLARIDPRAGALAGRIAELAADYYSEDSAHRRRGGVDLQFVEMRFRLLTAIRGRADAYLAVARF